MSGYRHGVYVTEVPTSLLPPRRVSNAVPFVVGTAPVHLLDETGPVNDIRLCYSYKEAVETFGYSADWAAYTLCEFVYAFFGLYNVAPIVAVNVFDPAVHKTDVTSEAATFANDLATLAHPGLVAAPTVKSNDDATTYIENTDYTVNRSLGRLTRLAAGSIPANGAVKVTYTYGDPSKVTDDDIIGGVDAATGKLTGLELANQVFPRFGIVPGCLAAPGWSDNVETAAVMAAKASNLNSHFKCLALVDLPASVTKYNDAPAYKTTNGLTDELMILTWPKVKLGTDEYWLSSHLAGLMAQVDGGNEDIPYESPSNKRLQINAVVAGGVEVWLGPEEANYLNGQGIVTALNFVSGWTLWGNRTAAYPGVTDVKDVFIPIRRMFNWMATTLVLTAWQKVDYPIKRRLIETIRDSFNVWLNGLAAREYILGGRVEFLEDENPVTDLMDGIIRFHVYVTPPSPAEEITFLVEYDPSYIKSLF
jgi:hypothetical protein